MKPSDKIAEEFRKNWERHDPFRNLDLQLSLVERLKDEADKELEKYSTGSRVPDWPFLYYNLALNSIVSSLEFFFRELVLNEHILDSSKKSTYYNKTTGIFDRREGNFQNYKCIRKFLQNEFKIDIETEMKPLEREWLRYIVMMRHILTHNGGTVDKNFIDSIESFSDLRVLDHSTGSWLAADSNMINTAKIIIQRLKRIIEKEVKKSDTPEIDILFES